MQSSESCAQSQGLELACRAEQGRHHKKRSAGKQQGRKGEKREAKPITQEKQCELVGDGG